MLLGHILAYQYIRESWIAPNHHLSIVDLEEFHIRSPLVEEYLDRSYFPLSLVREIYSNETILWDESLPKDIPLQLYMSLNDHYDPKLLPSLMLDSIYQSLTISDGALDSSFSLPFSWSSLLDLKAAFETAESMDCQSFGAFARIPSANMSHCEDLPKPQQHPYPKFKLTKPIDYMTPVEAARMIGHDYLLYSAPVPNRICFLGIGPGEKSIVVPISKSNNKKLALRELLAQFLAYRKLSDIKSLLLKGVDFHNTRNLIISQWSQSDLETSYVMDNDMRRDKFRIIDNSNYSSSLDKQLFLFELEPFYTDLQHRVTSSLAKFEINDLDTELLRNFQWSLADNIDYPKYFHEVRLLGNSKGAHFDWRFFKSTDFSRYETQTILHQLTRAWLQFADGVGLKTWLAHGTLLGWYWNGMNLPWDQDLDVQMTMDSLLLLARNHNQTLVVDTTGTGAYLIDIGPSFYSRVKGSGQNIIDARFIDVHTGFYVDITALSFTDSSKYMSVKLKDSSELNQLLDEQFLEKEQSSTIVQEDLYRDLTKTLIEFHNNETIFNCRNNHFYSIEDLSPLQTVLFEGVRGYVPQRYSRVLQREYKKGLLNYEHAQHRYRPVLHLWVPSTVCKKDPTGNRCFDRETLLEAKYLKPLTIKGGGRTKERHLISEKMILVDPWTLHRSKTVERIMQGM